MMPMSGDEWRRLRELEAQLASHRRLAALARRLESASVDRGPRQISVFWAATLVVVGAVSLVVEAAGYRREQRSAHGRRPRN